MNTDRTIQHRATPWLAMMLLVMTSPLAKGTSVLTQDLPAITQQADIIADVTVTSSAPYWVSPAGNRAIHTRVTFQVNRAIKGASSSTLVLSFPGGELNGVGLKVPGTPQFSPGERCILFSYSPDKNMVSPVLGFDQGALRIIHDNESNVDRVYRYWGEPVSESHSFTSRIPMTPETTTREYLRGADTVDQFISRLSQLIGPH
jgi:hypothetical protein